MIQIDKRARHNDNLTVRFGMGGNGVRPNYQVELLPNRVYPTRGNDHKADPRAPSGYDEAELSDQRFTLRDVQGLLELCLKKSSTLSKGRTPTSEVRDLFGDRARDICLGDLHANAA
jgi:hypothetical protein